jgi:hypothetical protein
MPPSGRPLARRAVVATAAVAASLAVLAGCNGDDGGDLPEFSPSAGSSPGATATTAPGPSASGPADQGPARLALSGERPAGGDEQAVYDAYVAFWRADVAALKDPSKSSAAVRKLALDPQRRRALADLEQMRVAGQRSIGTLTIAPANVTVDGRRATLSDCLDASTMSTVDSGGKPVPDSAGKRAPLDVTMNYAKNAWVVVNIQGGTGTC